jgi:hypothetical protein
MKRRYWLVPLLFLAGCVGVAWAQIALQPVVINDLKSNGTAVGFFKSPMPYYINFRNHTKTVGRTITVDVNAAPMNPDLGFTVGPNGVQVSTVDVARPTCDATRRGVFYTVQTSGAGDAGVKDLTYQCCKAAAGTYSWVAVACQ